MSDTLREHKVNNKGFTLVELLVALAISGVVIIMISLLIVNSSSMFNNENKNIHFPHPVLL